MQHVTTHSGGVGYQPASLIGGRSHAARQGRAPHNLTQHHPTASSTLPRAVVKPPGQTIMA